MTPTAFSTFSAIAEFFVTLGVMYVIWTNYRGSPFAWKLAAGIAVFEFFVNMLYMTIRMRTQSQSHAGGELTGMQLLAAVHGMLSLVVFVGFVVLSFLAWNASRRGEYFFQRRPGITWGYTLMWMSSVGSGWYFYFANKFA